MSNKISMDKKYRTRGWLDARVLCTDLEDGQYSVVYLIREEHKEQIMTCTDIGRYRDGMTSRYDLIEVKPYDDFEIDEPVYVRDSEDDRWKRRHFAGVSNKGYPLVFQFGATKWSNNGDKSQYRYCIKAGDLDNVDDSES